MKGILSNERNKLNYYYNKEKLKTIRTGQVLLIDGLTMLFKASDNSEK
jgi:hypothetical protein